MKLILLFILILSLNGQVVGLLTPLTTTRKDSAIQIVTPTGEKPITVRLMDDDVKSAKGQRWRGTICIFYDSSSGLYFWLHHLLPLTAKMRILDPQQVLHRGKVFVSNNQIVHFSYRGIVQSSERASSLDDAERQSLLAATAKLQSGELALMTAFRQPFNSGLLRDFTISPRSSLDIEPSVVDVQFKNSQWLVTVQGQWKEIITLDGNFQHVSHAPAPGETPKYWSTR